jgi:predicted dehydrogenase
LMGISMYGPQHWLLDDTANPGGSLYMMGVHFTETFQYLMGPIRQVSGFVVRNTAGTTIPEIAAGVFEFEGNCLGYLGSHYVAPYNSTSSIYCEKGIFHLEKFGRELFLQEAPFPKIERQVFPMDATPFGNPVCEEIEEFADCINGLRKPETGPEEAMAALAAVRGIIISAREKRPISIQEIIEHY